MASVYDFNIDQGTSVYKKIVWTNPDGSPIDTIGYSAKMQIRARYGSAIMAELTTENNGIVISPDGIIELSLTPSQSMNIITNGVYDLDLISPLGAVKRLLQGRVIVSQTVTR